MAEVKRRGWSGYRLSKESGLPLRVAQRYVSGETDLRAERAGKLLTLLGYELRRKPTKGA